MIGMEKPTDILVYTNDLGNVSTVVLIVDRRDKHTHSFITSRRIVDKSILFQDHSDTKFIDKAIENGGFFFNNKYVHIDVIFSDNSVEYNGMRIFLT